MIKFLGSLIPARFKETPDGLYHGKADQQKTQNNINTEQNRLNQSGSESISDSQQRVQDTTNRSNTERGGVWSGFSNLASDPGGGIDKTASDRLLGYGEYGPNGPHGGGGGGGSSSTGNSTSDAAKRFAPSYLDTFNELTGAHGGFDPTRQANLNKASGSLYDTSGNYGDVNQNIDKLSNADRNYEATNRSVSGLQGFAATGGLNAGQLSDIQRGSLKNIEQTGGYSDADIANERARSNAGIESTYANLSDSLNRQRLTGSNVGPGWSEAGFRLAREGAQAQGRQAQDTEAGIHERVTANRLAAGGRLGELGLGTANLQSQNTLSGYKDAGQLDVAKNSAIQDAWDKAGKLGLGRQAQIDAAKKAAADIDNQTQSTINNTRLSAAGGLSQDTLGRLNNDTANRGIGASSAAMSAALAAENQRFLISETNANRKFGLGGMLDTYGASPNDQHFQQNLLRGYNQDRSGNNNNMINNRISASYIPGIENTISQGLGIAGQVAGIASGATGGLGGMFKPKTASSSQPNFTNGIG